MQQEQQEQQERERQERERQFNAMLTTLQCTPATREKIRSYLVSVGLTKLADLTKNQMQELLNIVKPKDQYCDSHNCTHILDSSRVYDGQRDCHAKRAGCLGNSPLAYWVG